MWEELDASCADKLWQRRTHAIKIVRRVYQKGISRGDWYASKIKRRGEMKFLRIGGKVQGREDGLTHGSDVTLLPELKFLDKVHESSVIGIPAMENRLIIWLSGLTFSGFQAKEACHNAGSPSICFQFSAPHGAFPACSSLAAKHRGPTNYCIPSKKTNSYRIQYAL